MSEFLKMWKKSNTVPLFSRKPQNENTTKKPNETYSKFTLFSSGIRDILGSNREGSIIIPGLEVKNFERVKIVGQGSFGIAILYKHKKDNLLVVFKQINLNNLTQSEKDMAMNEVVVFSKLHHPNIISYLGSFVKENTLLIQMEFADGGNLAQIIAGRQTTEYFAERYIISIFEQITSGINYMHSQNILHRDLKTANIFLTNRGIVKIGDFGISKIMNTKIHAQTVLGTPYYFSPEMCEGKDYDHKSDIWALGCILGEMCCLHKSFAATNLSELVAKIMSGHYSSIPNGYSSGLKSFIDILLQVDVNRRPDASEILNYWLPLIYRNLGKHKGYSYNHELALSDYSRSETALAGNDATVIEDLAGAETGIVEDNIESRSVLYQLKAFGTSFTLTPIQLPAKACISCIATNGSHFIAVNEDGSVYAWGESLKGQLGLNSMDTWKHYPTRVESLRDHHIVGACTGDGFTIIWTNVGLVLSFGDNTKYALGHEYKKTFHLPKLLEKLRDKNIIQVAAGQDHVIALSSDDLIFVWGTSSCGALGLGSLHSYQKSPQNVAMPKIKSKPKKIICGPDTSVILYVNGEVYACGSNSYNKLGFTNKVHKVMSFKKVNLSQKIVDISISSTHSVYLDENGYVYTMGKNCDGQRGVGNCEQNDQLTLVTGIKEKHIKKVKCNDFYTIVSSDDNVISFWGTRYGIPEVNMFKNKSDSKNYSNSESSSKVDLDLGNSTKTFTNFLTSVYKTELLLEPIDILALYSSEEQLDKGHYVVINNIYPLPHSILVLVDTTTPLVSSSEEFV